MTDITELAQMKGQKVEGSYYLAECTDCGKMYPSNKLNGGEPLFSGDHGECYCPHCNADDAAIGDCGDTAAIAWNYQQGRIDALVEALESEQRICSTWRKTAEANRKNLEKAQKSNEFLKGQLSELANFNPDWDKLEASYDSWREVAAELLVAKERIAELESRTVSAAASDVLAERQRQVTAEGWTPGHDDEYEHGELADAAGCYALSSELFDCAGEPPRPWPWPDEWWKPTNRRRDLVKAGALILAEIERLDRAADVREVE